MTDVALSRRIIDERGVSPRDRYRFPDTDTPQQRRLESVTSERTRAAHPALPPVLNGEWLALAAVLGKRAVDGCLAAAVMPTARHRGRHSLMVRYDGDHPALPRDTLMRALRRIRSRPCYIGSFKRSDLYPFQSEVDPPLRQALTAVRLPVCGIPGCLIVLGKAGQRFNATDLFRLEDVARIVASGLQQEQRTLAEDRHRIGRLFHDTFAATLTAISLNLSRLNRSELSPAARRLTAELSMDVGTALRQLRSVIDAASHGSTPAQGTRRLSDLLTEIVDEGIQIHSQIEESLASSLPAQILACIYEVAREALVNVRRHAHASQVDLILRRTGSGVELLVSDDGRGCTGAKSDSAWGGHGLRLMRERVAEIGGEMHFHSSPGVGSQILVRFSTPESMY